ncbi:MAG: acetoacetate--CoA ligase, partial [Actinomycetota bacterium]|nr:acetoacetate--CoA ligase [Actinomycetota bacterium]
SGQDYAPHAAADRLAQLRPAVLVAADGYRHGGRAQDRRNALVELAGHLRDAGDLRATISVPRLGLDQPSGTLGWEEVTAGDDTLDPLEVPFDHPLWVLFSSGTTGRPKGIVHGHGGVLLEHLKQAALHADLRAGERFCWYTSPSWMMWNYQLAGLLVGATIVTYDGSPGWPATGSLFGLAAEERLAVLGTSPAYLLACEKAGCHPGAGHDLSSLRLLGVTGSVLPASSYRWAETELGGRVTIGAISGGTDVVSAFVGSTPGVPTRPGELAGAHLGVALDAWDPEGHPVRGEVGELVVTEPMPSMPLRLWDDPDGSRYREAYFSTYPGVWRHGDWVTITEHGGVVIHGRSDSTLNRNGIRMGSAEIYEAVESLPEVVESLVVGVEEPGGGYWMPLFVVLGAGSELDEQLEQAIRRAVREQVSPRHVPDEVIAVRAVPHTRTGKKLEVPVKRLLQGAEASAVLDPGAIDDPGALADFVAAAQRRARTSG